MSADPASPELTPWARFDDAVRELGLGLEGVSSVRIAQVFDKLSDSLRELSIANRPEEALRQRRAS